MSPYYLFYCGWFLCALNSLCVGDGGFTADEGFVEGEGVDGGGWCRGNILVRGSSIRFGLLGGARIKKEGTRSKSLLLIIVKKPS